MINNKGMFNRCMDCGAKVHRKSKRCRACSIAYRQKNHKKTNEVSLRNGLRMFQKSDFKGNLKQFLNKKKLKMVAGALR